MFNIVATNDDQLALPVDIEGVDHAEPGLSGAPAAGAPDPTAEDQPQYIDNQKNDNQYDKGANRIGQHHAQIVVTKKLLQRVHT